jgi:uroporphyrinogen decarboxylase
MRTKLPERGKVVVLTLWEVVDMTSKERVLAALQRTEPDKVPTFEWVIHPSLVLAMTGQTSEFEFIRRMKLDGMAVGTSMKRTKIDSRHFVDEWGITRASYDEYPNAVGFPVASELDLEKLNIPDPDAEYRFDDIVKAMSELGEDKAIIIQLRDVFSQPRDLMGFEHFLMGFYMQPDLVRRLMEISVAYNLKLAQNARELGGEIIVIGDDIADTRSLLISPELYRENVLPHFRKLVEGFKKMGYFVIKHTDGNIKDVLDDLVESGIDCLDPIDPLAGMHIGEMKEKYGSRICLKGNVDCVETLTKKSLDDVVAETKKCILDASRGGGHIISSSNSLHSGIKPENYRAFLDAVDTFGTYPLNIRALQN